jgi:hypothetical protein
LRHIDLVGSLRETAAVHDGDEVLEMTDVHGLGGRGDECVAGILECRHAPR